MKLLILAAGMGSRFGGLKQIEPVDDYQNYIIDYSVYDAISAGFDSVVFLIKEEIYDEFRETIGKRVEGRIKVEYAFQRQNTIPSGYNVPSNRVKPWGTAHAILECKDIINESFAMINADDYYGKDAFIVAAKAIKELKGTNYASVAYKAKNTMTEHGGVKRGVCYKNNNNELDKLIESSISFNDHGTITCKPLDGSTIFETSPDTLVSMNLFVFTKEIFKQLEEGLVEFFEDNKNDLSTCEYLIPTYVDELIHSNKATVKVLDTKAIWYGITYKEDKPGVVKALKEYTDNGDYPVGLWK